MSARHAEHTPWWAWLGLAALVAAFVLMAALASPQKSGSFDEQYHLAAGYSYLKTGDFRMATTHPPLVGVLAALPLLGDDAIVLPLESEWWQAAHRHLFADEFVWRANAPRGPQMLVAARQSVILLGALVVVAVFLWGRALVGVWGALVAATLAAFDPNLIANSRQVTTDMGVTLFLLLALWALWRRLEGGGRWAVVAAGVCAGAAMGAKYNGMLIWPAALLVLALHPGLRRDSPRRALELRRRALDLLIMGAAAFVTLWAIYRFEGGTIAVGGVQIWLPLRFYWLNAANTLGGLLETSHPNFLLGEIFWGTRWSYFPVALVLKTPLPLLLLTAAGVAALVRYGGARRQAALWAPALLLLALALSGLVTIGYRHILPVLPLACLLAANSVRWVDARRRIWPVGALAAALASLIVSTVSFFPHHDSYFNVLAGHWTRWSELLVDSNLDWGQDLPALAALQQELGIEELNLAYFGQAVPEQYGVRYHPLPGYLRFVGGREPAAFNAAAPEPGWYAISATSLRLGTYAEGQTEIYAAFRNLQPVARAGYSIALYQIAPEAAARPAQVVTGTPAWQLGDGALVAGAPAQILWRQSEATQIVPAATEPGAPAPQSQLDAALEPFAVQTPVETDFAGVFALERIAVERQTVRPGETLRGLLLWRRGAAPVPMPAPTTGEAISAFVHVLSSAAPDQRLTQFDGWEVALRGLAPGDRILQPIELAIPAEAEAGLYTVHVGLYSPQNGQRLLTTGAATLDALPVLTLIVEP